MKNLSFIAGLTLLVGCATTENVSVKNVQDLTAYGSNTFVYSLPRTKLRIDIIATRNYTVPGPYYKYATKFLGLTGISSPVENWEIEKIDVETLEEPDPDYYFAIESTNSDKILKDVLGLYSSGLILKVDDTNPFVQYNPDYKDYSDQLNFTDLSIKRNFVDPAETEKVKAKKSNFPVGTPTGKQKGGIKSIEEKAEEAANFIYKIRKRRFKLLSGQYDTFPDGAALQTSIYELNKLEQDYLSLFIGKTFTDTIQKIFFYIPKPGSDLDRYVVCHFSAEKGFEASQSDAGKSLVLELKDLQLTAPLDRLEMPITGSNGKNCILYRIPDKASMQVYFGSLTSVEGEIKVYQYGTLAPYCIKPE